MRVLVVGGGLMGSAVAYELARRAVEVVVLDRQDVGRATSAGAGILSGSTAGLADTAYHELAVRAHAYYQTLVHDLGRDALGYGVNGLALVALDGDEDRFQKTREALRGRAPDVVDMDPDELRQRFPALGPVTGALYHAGAARVDGRLLESRLRAAATALGTRFHRQDVLEIDASDGAVRGAYTSDGRLAADAVVVAAGAWSSRLLRDFAPTVPVIPHRGQIAHVEFADAQGAPWPTLEGFRGHYILPWPDGHIVAGATREPGSGFTPWLTAGGQAEVLAELFRVAPGLKPALVREWRVGLRPASADGRPLLGAVSGTLGLHVITGHGAGGLLLGPYSAHLVAAELVGATLDVDLSPFRPDRPFRLDRADL